MKPPPRNLKRKRSTQKGDEGSHKVIKSPRVEDNRSLVETSGDAPSPPRYTTSETSGLTSADEVATVTSATGIDTDESKHASESGRLPVINPISEIVTAYKNATEILIEIANRDRYKSLRTPYVGFRGPVYSTPYTNIAPNNQMVSYASVPINAYTTPYGNGQPSNYVTPYTNPPVIGEAIEYTQHNIKNHQTRSSASSEDHGIHHDDLDETGRADIIPEGTGSNATEPTELPKDDEANPMPLNLLDGFLALANGGVLPGKTADSYDSNDHEHECLNDSMLFAPPSPNDTIDESLSRLDDDIHAIVDEIADELINTEEATNQIPPANPYAAFCSSMNGKQLGAELKRLAAVVRPEINAIMSLEQIQAAHLFYTHLIACVQARNTRNMQLAQAPVFSPPAPMHHHWGPAPFFRPPQPPQLLPPPPPAPPGGFTATPTLLPSNFPPPVPSPQPRKPSFVPRGNVIAPPVVRNPEEERKVAVFGFPPVPSSRTDEEGPSSAVKRARRKQRGSEH